MLWAWDNVEHIITQTRLAAMLGLVFTSMAVKPTGTEISLFSSVVEYFTSMRFPAVYEAVSRSSRLRGISFCRQTDVLFCDVSRACVFHAHLIPWMSTDAHGCSVNSHLASEYILVARVGYYCLQLPK